MAGQPGVDRVRQDIAEARADGGSIVNTRRSSVHAGAVPYVGRVEVVLSAWDAPHPDSAEVSVSFRLVEPEADADPQAMRALWAEIQTPCPVAR